MRIIAAWSTLFLSTPSARRATFFAVLKWHRKLISIHALREEGDPMWPWRRISMTRFLSTPSARRATCSRAGPSWRMSISIHALREEGDQRHYSQLPPHHHFYPRPPRGGRPCALIRLPGSIGNFYPRPPRGGRQTIREYYNIPVQFLSTPSARRATCSAPIRGQTFRYFYPRPPRGGRLAFIASRTG